ncbi:hypothetical protein RIF29_03647 [Crotalaria pallida]|uniref:Uncharacterized protein n=1 Tax=Crotalaria pallida TaxID=3830 RepID=A0AAN9J066_CROPI
MDDDAQNGVDRKLEIESRNLDVEIREEEEGEKVQRNYGGGTVRVCGDGVACFEDDAETNKTMKEFIDIEFRSRKNSGRDFREIAGSFCKRLIKWRRKQKLKKTCGGGRDSENCIYIGGAVGRRLKGTQSEVGEYGLLGRRSCDTDPRLSIDASRMSLDGYGYDSRFSFEAPRASWDGYLIGKACPRYSPMVPINDSKVLVYEDEEEEEEGVNLESVGEHCPGGSVQTKDYYSDSHGRRRSFDRSNSRRRLSMANIDELRVISNAKVSPATTELFYGAKVLITDKDLGENLNNVQSDCVLGNASKDASDIVTRVDQKGLKKLHKWGRLWNKLGLVQRRKEDKSGEEEYGAGDMGNRPISDSWQKLRRAVNGQASGSVSQKLIRSYSVSCRNPCRGDGLAHGVGRPESKGNVSNGRQELLIQRNRSIGYSPNNIDTGLLRFYLTPLKSYRRSRSGRSGLKDLNPTARNVL